MDSRLLESFIMVAEHGSIAEAARRLSITSAGVAQRIRALEADIGTRLIARSGQRVRPTEAGLAIVNRSRSVLKDLRDLKSIAVQEQPAGELRLGATGSATSGLLPDILRLLMERYPRIEIYMLSGNGAELYRAVLEDQLDAAVISCPPFAIPKAYGWHSLREEKLVVLAPTTVRTREPHAILASEPFIRPRLNSWLGQLVDGYLRHAGIRPRERFEIDTLEAIAVMVDRGLGAALMPDFAPPWPEGLSVRKIALAENPFSRKLGLIWSRTSARIRLVEALLEVAGEAVTPTHARSPIPATSRSGSRAKKR